jgi:hypothetical protein
MKSYFLGIKIGEISLPSPPTKKKKNTGRKTPYYLGSFGTNYIIFRETLKKFGNYSLE